LKKTFHKIGFILSIIFAVALLLSYLSVYISPEDFAFLAFFGLLFPVFLLANLFFLVSRLLQRKWNFLIPFLTIALGWGHIGNYFQINLKQECNCDSPNSFKLLSYNVRLFDLYNWIENDSTKHDILRLVSNEEPDIICFQEFHTKRDDTTSIIGQLLGIPAAKYYHFVYNTISPRRTNSGIATFSKFPIINSGEIRFKNTSNVCIYTDIVIWTDTIRVYNNHLASFHLSYSDYNFIDSIGIKDDSEESIKGVMGISRKLNRGFVMRAQQVNLLAEHIRYSPYPVVVCGDFNDTPVSYTYHKMRKNLKDAFVESGKGIGNTYNYKIPIRIDYILHDPSLEAFDFRVLHVPLSDHFPVVSRFSFSYNQ